jgi:hypothetical protein
VNIYFDYGISVNFTRASSIYSDLNFGEPIVASQDMKINKTMRYYDLTDVVYEPEQIAPEPEEEEFSNYWYCLAALLIAIPISLYIYKKYKKPGRL